MQVAIARFPHNTSLDASSTDTVTRHRERACRYGDTRGICVPQCTLVPGDFADQRVFR